MTIEDTTLNPNLEQSEIVSNNDNDTTATNVAVEIIPEKHSEPISAPENSSDMETAPLETAPKMEAFSTSSEEYKKAVAEAGGEINNEVVADTNSSEFDELFEQLKTIKDNNGTIDVTVQERIRGGLRVVYNNMPLFLPSSHFSMKRSPSEELLTSAIGTSFPVNIHELQEDETKRKTVIVSRKQQLENEFWASIKVGDVVEGVVSSIATFGVFIDLGGIEGLIHVSRLSNTHVPDPKAFTKKGQTLKATVIEVNKSKRRIALSMREFEDSPWTNISEKYPSGTVVKGVVRRFTDFGAYVELTPGIDGLLRTSELSWTRRLKSPSDLLQIGQEIDVEVLNSNAEKRTVALSYKKIIPNPWNELKNKYPLGSEMKGTVTQIVQQGCVVNIDNEIDGFMPRSKMRNIIKGNKIPFSNGELIDVVIADLSIETQSLILAPKETESFGEDMNNMNKRKDRPRRDGDRDRDSRKSTPIKPSNDPSSNEGFSFGDLLSDLQKKSLLNKS